MAIANQEMSGATWMVIIATLIAMTVPAGCGRDETVVKYPTTAPAPSVPTQGTESSSPTGELVCGDAQCVAGETCAICPEDCGACEPTPPAGKGCTIPAQQQDAPCGAACYDNETGKLACLWTPSDFGTATGSGCDADADGDGISASQGDCNDGDPSVGFCWWNASADPSVSEWSPPPRCVQAGYTMTLGQ